MKEIARIKTGITGIDTMLYGGVPEQSQVLIAGGPGAGKTMLCFNILYNIAKSGTNAAFITFDEQPAAVIRNAEQAFSDLTDIDQLIADKKLVVDGTASSLRITTEVTDTMYSFGTIVSDLEGIIRSNDAKVAVVDSISLLKLMLGDPAVYYKAILALVSNLRRMGVTAFLTVELESQELKNLKFSQDSIIFDGMFTMYQNAHEESRTLEMEIIKMRGSNHSRARTPYGITPQGFKTFATADR